jgi:HAD superfamily hydrolase (TIGR01450 family)
MAEVVAGRGEWGNIATVVCDLDGVVYVGGHEVPGAGSALSALRNQGRRLLFVTNNSMKTPEMVARTIGELAGFDVDHAEIVTCGLVTAMTLEAAGIESVFIVGGPALAAAMSSRGLAVVSDWRRAEAVVSGMDMELAYEDLADATLAIRAGARFYGTNADANFPSPEGLVPGGGAILAALITATGVEPTICGKPHQPMADAVAEIAGDGPVLVVGDRPDTDLALGKHHGWATALVLSGVTTDLQSVPAVFEPDIVMDSLADLPEILGR